MKPLLREELGAEEYTSLTTVLLPFIHFIMSRRGKQGLKIVCVLREHSQKLFWG